METYQASLIVNDLHIGSNTHSTPGEATKEATDALNRLPGTWTRIRTESHPANNLPGVIVTVHYYWDEEILWDGSHDTAEIIITGPHPN